MQLANLCHASSHCQMAKHLLTCSMSPLQDPEKQRAAETDLLAGITEFVKGMDPEGPFFFGEWFSMVDIMLAPWLFHTPTALKQFKGFELPSSGSPIWDRWVNRMLDSLCARSRSDGQ